MKYMPSLRQLKYAVALEEHGNFTLAAESCFVAQPSFSAGIRQLEENLGVVLFERTTRQVIVTPEGRRLIRRARDILSRVQELVEETCYQPFQGNLKLGTIPTIGPYILPQLLDCLSGAYPDLNIYIREEKTEELLRHLDEGRLDVLLLATSVESSQVIVEDLPEDALKLVCSRSHPFAREETVSLESLRNATLLVLEDGHCLRDQTLTACGLTNLQANESFQATSLKTLAHMVANNLGVALFPELALAEEVHENPKLLVRDIATGNPTRTLCLARRASSPRQEEFAALAEMLTKLLTKKAV